MNREMLVRCSDDTLYICRDFLLRKQEFLSPHSENWQETVNKYNLICEEISRREKLEGEL